MFQIWLLRIGYPDLVVVKKEPQQGRFSKLRGHAGKGMDTDAIMVLTRGYGLLN